MNETAKIRVNVDVVTLEVNDNGDTVVLPVSDERFAKRLYDYAEKSGDRAQELENLNGDKKDIIMENIKFHEELKVGFDDLFGAGAYTKVFGEDIVVGAEYIIDFLNQCIPFIETHVKNRAKKLNKYSADRVGSSL